MKQRALLLIFAALTLTTGCSLFKKSQKPKEVQNLAADTDENFRQRFVDKRAAELVAQGLAENAARAQAQEEFKVRYSYASPAKK